MQVEGRIYLAWATFETRDEAISAGSQLKSEGESCLLVRARDRFTVWQAASKKIQAEILGSSENVAVFRGRPFDPSQTPDTAADSATIEKIRFRGRKIAPDV
ncbi:hypothetical protein [Synechococcus sp. PCC 7336]|uniref:hypothetical protein n=1 Tax=Synechococcus sp. PCC 7336 TaxID=195250 RepID=UPI00034D18D6|nr:hypothetical protein [Synechococcus sp. PCC 7336]